MLNTPDVNSLVTELHKRCEHLRVTEEPELLDKDEIYARYLKSRNWDIDGAEKMLIKSVSWRNETKPLHMECGYCRTNPGAHTLRQIGFDDADRPVIYASFFPAHPSQRNSTTNVLQHTIFVLENAVRSMREGVSNWVFIVDCAGMTPTSCHPRIGYECAQVMSSHYPERLGLAICIRPGPVFKVALQAIKQFLPATTASKLCIVNSKSQLQSTLNKYCSSALSTWVMTEYKSNRQKPARLRYRPFWLENTPSNEEHDPRGVAEYVTSWVKTTHPSGHLPHPNLVDYLAGRLNDTPTMVGSMNSEDAPLEDEEESGSMTEDEARKLMDALPQELQIPAGAEKMTS